jgi:hypothetical protein
MADNTDLEAALDNFANELQTLIDSLIQNKETQRSIQAAQAQGAIRTAAGIIGAVNLLQLVQGAQADVDTLTGATETLNANADRIAQQQRNVSAALGIANAAAEVAAAVAPFNLAKIVQGLVDLKGVATQ